MALTFKPLYDFPPGAICSLLVHSYADWSGSHTDLFRSWQREWQEYDDDLRRYPSTVGRCGFVSCLGEAIVGFASWDPRLFPTARVGHNCILPGFRGRGHGTGQLRRIIATLRDLGFHRALASTGDVAFFAPARRMYERCGFTAVGSHPPGNGLPFGTTGYELVL